jgi:hypothetical protein
LLIGIQQAGSLIDNNVQQLREIILNNTLNNDFLIQNFNKRKEFDNITNINEYVLKHSKNGVWGTSFEIMSCSLLFKKIIYVLSSKFIYSTKYNLENSNLILPQDR